MKTCTNCKQEKEESNFYKKNSYCKTCHRARSKLQAESVRNTPKPLLDLTKTKICTKCGQEKTLDLFGKNYLVSSGIDSRCKICLKAKDKVCKNRITPEQNRKTWLKKAYKLSIEEYDRMLENQKGLCAICGEPETKIDYRSGKPKSLSVDHDHATGKVRELLCFSCNLGLGAMRDSIPFLENMIQYLEEDNAQTS